MLSSCSASLPPVWIFILCIWSTSVYLIQVISVALCWAALIITICESSLLHHFGSFFSFALLQSWRKLKSASKVKNLPFTPPLVDILCFQLVSEQGTPLFCVIRFNHLEFSYVDLRYNECCFELPKLRWDRLSILEEQDEDASWSNWQRSLGHCRPRNSGSNTHDPCWCCQEKLATRCKSSKHHWCTSEQGPV